MHRLFIALQYILPKQLLSRLAGALAASRSPWLKNLLISAFIKQFRVNMEEALYPNPKDYESFNDFFTRPLKPGARALADSDHCILSPADGAISQLGTIKEGRIFQAKGQSYTTEELLGGDNNLAGLFQNGSFATIYLSPRDYHRVHMPITGRLQLTQYLGGDLFSVNQVTAENVPRLFSRNERMVNTFETELGTVAVIMVGAMIVAGIDTVWGGGPKDGPHQKDHANSAIALEAGDEMARFYLGSTAIVLFREGQVEWNQSLEAGAPIRMGQALAKKIKG